MQSGRRLSRDNFGILGKHRHKKNPERLTARGFGESCLKLDSSGWAAGVSGPLQTRVGIAAGIVVVGDLIGTGSAQEQAVVGETANLAARLPPAQVLRLPKPPAQGPAARA
jgi:hypothetical protein